MRFEKIKLLLLSGFIPLILCEPQSKHQQPQLPSFATEQNGVMGIGTKNIVKEYPFVNPYLDISKSVIIPETHGVLVVEQNKPLTKLNIGD